MRRVVAGSIVAVVLMTLVFGFAYPVVMTGFAAAAFPHRPVGA